MGEAAQMAVERALAVLDRAQPAEVAKTIWGSPAGKKRLSGRLAALLPAHKTYVEPFCGSAAVLFAKEPSAVEVIGDADPDIAEAYRLVKKLTPEATARLKRMEWTGDEATFKRLLDAKPSGDVEKLHRFLYLTHFSYGKMRGRSFSPSVSGIEARTVDRIETFLPRLKGVTITSGDYETAVRKYDAKDTVFFFDPPYAGYDAGVGEGKFDEERFFEVLKSLKGKFLLTYGIRGKLPGLLEKSRFTVQRIRTPRTIRAMRGVGGSTVLTQLLVANYPLDGRAAPKPKPDADPEPTEKRQPFGTFGGSFRYAKRIVPLIGEHETYVEPFAGAAAVLHAKDPSPKEVLADVDEDVVFLHRFIKSMDEGVIERLCKLDWTCTEASWKRVRDMTPRSEVERFYKLAFIRGKGRDSRPDATHAAGSAIGSTIDPAKYLAASERLKDVTILRQDYRKTIEAYDGPKTFFFLDPPYPGEWFDKDAAVDVDEFVAAMKGIKGRFIAVLNDAPEHVRAFKSVGQVFRLTVTEASGTGGAKQASRLFCANYRVRKADGCDVVDVEGEPAFEKPVRLIKGTDPADERYVLGIVLEPEVVDAQGDIYSAEEIRKAAHRFMEDFGGLGLMHRTRVNGDVKVLESFLAPADFEACSEHVRKGTWLLAVRVLSDALWADVKDGTLGGFSIGGTAARRAESAPAAEAREAA